ncbi:MAG: GNAT family N-acetyltransferase [Bdellovibrionales bacterium]|nr:GNAT family N-acetyltransferase [Bdellovibrionales bacterium]
MNGEDVIKLMRRDAHPHVHNLRSKIVNTSERIELKSQRLVLRDYKADLSEIDAIFEFTGDALVATHSSWGPLTRDETLDWLNDAVRVQNTEPRAGFELGVCLAATGRIVGNASLHIRNLKNNEAEIGYTLNRAEWGQGYGTEVAKTLLAFAFNKLYLHRVYASTAPSNIASHRVLEKLGMTREGLMRENVLQRGHWRDSFIYSILDKEFLDSSSLKL